MEQGAEKRDDDEHCHEPPQNKQVLQTTLKGDDTERKTLPYELFLAKMEIYNILLGRGENT